jgi:beta-glucosidase
VDGVVETASWKNMVDGILLAWLPGQEGGKAMADVLTGKVNPSGKLPITFPNSYSDTPTHPNFPHDYVHPHDKKMFDYAATMRDTHENGKTKRCEKPVSEWVKNVDYTNYEEDIYVGYRYYDTFEKPVSYPFGFGLSYTTFKYGKPRLTEIDDTYQLDIEVANTGSAAGKEVLQFYASSPATPAGQPAHELVAFAKTRLLEPGEKQSLKLVFTKKDLARYDSARVAWILDAGQYILASASSSRDIRASTMIVVTKEQVLESTTNSVQPEAALNVIKPCVDPAGQTTVCS